MSEHFEVGEVAYHVLWRCDVQILSPLEWCFATSDFTGERTEWWRHRVRRSDGKLNPYGHHNWMARPENLRKKRPPSDHLKVTTWDECPWRPERVSA